MDERDYKAMNEELKKESKTKLTLKSIIDGFGTYLFYYLFTALMIWLGIKLMKIYQVSYLQSLGFVIVFRQVKSLIKINSDKHVKDIPQVGGE